jgi:very-short-patch-repair endonuclease
MLMMTERQARLSPALRKKIPKAARPKSNAARSIEWAFSKLLPDYKLIPEYPVQDGRRWRFDWAIPALRLAVELEGIGGLSRHTSITGYTKDCEKYNAAAAQGWCVLRFTPRQALAKNFLGTLDELLGMLQEQRRGIWRAMI